MRFPAAVVAVVVPALAAPAALAADLRVPQQHATIQAAVDAAAPGDRVVVSRGVWREAVVVSTERVALLGRGAVLEPPADDIWSPQFTVRAADVRIEGFTFRRHTNQIRADDEAPAHRLTVRRCVSRAAGGYFLNVTGDDVRVDGCRIALSHGIYVIGERLTVVGTTLQNASAPLTLSGNGLVVDRCSFRNVTGTVRLLGNDAAVTRTTFQNLDGSALDVHGGGIVRFEANRLAFVTGYGVRAQCAEATVAGNRFDHVEDSPVDVSAAWVSVTGNTIHDVVSDYDAIRVAVSGTMDVKDEVPSVVADNVVEDVNYTAIYVTSSSGAAVRVTSNRVSRCGAYDASAFALSGRGIEASRNTAQDIFGDGFHVSGDAVLLADCAATRCTGDGFRVNGGSDTRLERCKATACDLEGLDNRGQATDVVSCTFLGNRTDVVVSSWASFSDPTLAGNRFVGPIGEPTLD